MTNSQPVQWQTLIKHVIDLSKQKEGNEKEIACLRRGSSSVTEYYAYPYVLPHTDRFNQEQKTALLRAVAALVEYPEIPAFNTKGGRGYRSFGSWCYQLSKRLADDKKNTLNPDKPDVVGQRLAYLHTQPLEEAVLSVRRLLALARNLENPPALDKYNLVRTLIFWGNGLSSASQENRRQILRDYYSSFNYTLSQAEEDSPAEDQ
ncbi:type I-E CRISPR-associated protein Cse2/CasB [Rothia sp. P4278]|uniref:type I-E CRISPR-associated protein Cse2/CasB n=1 Tax=Rothia sp. P4278 TaxID=3402658 RepID=UPI003AE35155